MTKTKNIDIKIIMDEPLTEEEVAAAQKILDVYAGYYCSNFSKEEIIEKLELQEQKSRSSLSLNDSAFYDSTITPLGLIGGTLEVFNAYRVTLKNGLCPPPIVLYRLYELIEKYMAAEGRLTLEAAFDLERRQGHNGHPLLRKRDEAKLYEAFCNMSYLIGCAEKAGKQLSVARAAEITKQQLNLKIEEDALRKKYGAYIRSARDVDATTYFQNLKASKV